MWGKKRKNKFGNKKIEFDGKKFDSIEEHKYYLHLLSLKRAGDITGIVFQPKYILQESFKLEGVTRRAITYTADYLITYPDGTSDVIDVKGVRTEVFNIKAKMFEKKFDKVLKVVKYENYRWVEH